MNSRNIGPRIGGAFLVTEDARNVVRAFFGRVHEQVNGRDPITTFGPTSRRFQRDIFDTNGDGIFEIEQVTPAATAAINALAFDPKLHQPFVDEYAVGYAKQFPGQISLDLSFNRRYFKDAYAEIDINGIYPSGPNQPFGGFGLRRSEPGHDHAADQRHLEPGGGHQRRGDPRQEPVAQLPGDGDGDAAVAAPRRHLESRPTRRASSSPTRSRTIAICRVTCSATATTTASMAAARNRASPTGRTRCASPGSTSRRGKCGSLPATSSRPAAISDPSWCRTPPVIRSSDPGASRLANGTTQANPLATSWRFAYATRSEGQLLQRDDALSAAEPRRGRSSSAARAIDAGLGIFNVFNTGAHTQWNTGANRLNNSLYLSRFNRHPPRAFQLTLGYKF